MSKFTRKHPLFEDNTHYILVLTPGQAEVLS